MRIQGKESGLALIVTLLLGLIAAGFIGAMMYALGTGAWVSGLDARYTSSLQAAKGGASYITQQLGSYNLRCRDASNNTCYCDYLSTDGDGEEVKCPSNSTSFAQNASVILDPSVETLGDYDIDAKLLSMAHNNNSTTYVFTFNLTAESNRNTEERSEIEFVYKVE